MNPIREVALKEIEQKGYAHPEALVTTEWVQQNLDNPSVRLVESNEDTLLYASGHVRRTAHVDWTADLNDPVRRDYLGPDDFAALMGRLGVTPETMVVFYGDKNNWWACYALWVFELFGHTRARVMDGGRLKWLKEQRPTTTDVPRFDASRYGVPHRDDKTNRAFRDEVLKFAKRKGQLVDVRSPEEYSGERLHMPDYPNEGALRGGHIPGAKSIPWSRAINPADGTFRDAAELRRIYVDEQGLSPDRETIAYCRIGERSSHTWFVLKYLLGFKHVRNYDGSWTEWGNLVGVPVERAAARRAAGA
jgi:thiosulfate/3-mercaptopyruvate sulfurtransferase